MATDNEALVLRAGKKVQVRGRVSRIGALRDGRMTFINFATNETKRFVGILDPRALALFLREFPEGLEKALVGKAVLIEGVITLYRGIPQIELKDPRQFRIEANRHNKGDGADSSQQTQAREEAVSRAPALA